MRQVNALIVFARLPVPGTVKTRLGSVLGMEEAARVYAEIAGQIFKLAGVFSARTGAAVRLYYDPVFDRNEFERWVGLPFACHPQRGSSLGERMENAFRETFRDGFSAAVIVGTDVPELSQEILSAAFASLEQGDVVIGPSTDGGYYLLGMKQVQRELFEAIAWSTDTVLRVTLKRLQEQDRAVVLLPPRVAGMLTPIGSLSRQTKRFLAGILTSAGNLIASLTSSITNPGTVIIADIAPYSAIAGDAAYSLSTTAIDDNIVYTIEIGDDYAEPV